MLQRFDVGNHFGFDEPPDRLPHHQLLFGPLEHDRPPESLDIHVLVPRGYPRSAYSRYVRLKRQPEQTAYDRWGGEPFFTVLIERFYEGVATDPLLRPLYPDDLTASKSKEIETI